MMSDKSATDFTTPYAVSHRVNIAVLSATTRSQATTDALKSYILRHDLKPGDPLPTEQALCAELGVSRSSVREALRTLAALDIISVQQGRGAFVGEMSLDPLIQTLVLRSSLDSASQHSCLGEVVELRKQLDLGVATAVVAAFEGTQNPELGRLVTTMEEQAARGASFMEADKAFHDQLLARLNGTLTRQLTNALWLVHMTVVPQLQLPDAPDMLDTARAHRTMLSAAEAGDLNAYREAVADHYRPLELLLAVRQ